MGHEPIKNKYDCTHLPELRTGRLQVVTGVAYIERIDDLNVGFKEFNRFLVRQAILRALPIEFIFPDFFESA